MAISKASAQWNGTLKSGSGVMKPAHAAEIPFSLGSRFEGQSGSNPEELVGAAFAGCFSMALSVALEQAGSAAKTIRTTATVKLERRGWGGSADTDSPFEITSVDLTTEVDAPGMDDGRFQQIVDVTKKNCPVGKALASVKELGVSAKLVSK